MDGLLIKELQSQNEILQAFPVIRQLRTQLDENTYLELVKESQEKERYKMFALFDHDEIVAVTGIMPMVTLYYGRFVWVCDLVTDIHKRSKGYGAKLLAYVHQWAKEHNYKQVALSSGLQRIDAHRFYVNKMNYDQVSYVFKKSLE